MKTKKGPTIHKVSKKYFWNDKVRHKNEFRHFIVPDRMRQRIGDSKPSCFECRRPKVVPRMSSRSRTNLKRKTYDVQSIMLIVL